ncbi:hypothetical protein CEXT_95831 [Caerostris extrusa]|uniref:Uncharacterized protein n=1 Tax=Caerostris extrusa TaxID=172846 RepID=A0AAV4RD03_CAEEX|nr:hypothetical protein CEXT_95831 [Caerostris extrusa]
MRQVVVRGDFLLGFFFPVRLGTVRKRGCDFLLGFFLLAWGLYEKEVGKSSVNRSGYGVYQTRKYPAILKKLSLKSTRFPEQKQKFDELQQSAGGEILKILVTMGEEKKKDRRMEER